MTNENYSKKVRKFILENAEFSINALKYYGVDEKHYDELFWNSLDSMDDDYFIRIIISTPNSKIDIEKAKLMVMLSRLQIVTDYYRYIKFQDIIYNREDSLLFPKIKSYDDVKTLFSVIDLANEMLDTTREYNEASAYDKVLLSKSLDEEDIEYLSNLNPLFKEENDRYLVNVDINFILNQIKKWQSAFKNDINKSYEATAEFLIYLNKINEKESLDIINQMLQILNKTIFIQNNYVEGSNINVNGMIIDELLLTQIIKDYYKQVMPKKLEYRKDK